MTILKRIILFCLPVMLFVSLFLALLGVEHIELDNTYYNFMQRVVLSADSWKVTIPNIPQIPITETIDGIDILKVLVSFVNSIITVLNILVLVINTIFHILQFVLTFIAVVIKGLYDIAFPPVSA